VDLIKVIESDEITVIIHSKSCGCSNDYILVYADSLFIKYKLDEIPEMLNDGYFNIDSNTLKGIVNAFNLQRDSNGEFFLPSLDNTRDSWISIIKVEEQNIKFMR
jgi:hypothetical protein